MRFRQKFNWAQVAAAAGWMLLSYLWLKKPYLGLGGRDIWKLTGTVWCFLLLFQLFSSYFIWWELNDDGLTERRLFSKRTVPWIELVSVGPWNTLNTKSRSFVEAEYHRSPPISESGKFLLRVKEDERQTLFKYLRGYAPQAQIDSF